MNKLPRALVGSVTARHAIAGAYERFMSEHNSPDLALFELFMAGWDAGQSAKAAATPLDQDLIKVLRLIREQAPRWIGGEPYLVQPGAFYAIDLLFGRPDVAPLLSTGPALAAGE